jgi:hypothetical protein
LGSSHLFLDSWSFISQLSLECNLSSASHSMIHMEENCNPPFYWILCIHMNLRIAF